MYPPYDIVYSAPWGGCVRFLGSGSEHAWEIIPPEFALMLAEFMKEPRP